MAHADAYDPGDWQLIDSSQLYKGTKFQIDLIHTKLSWCAGPSSPFHHLNVHPGVAYSSIDTALSVASCLNSKLSFFILYVYPFLSLQADVILLIYSITKTQITIDPHSELCVRLSSIPCYFAARRKDRLNTGPADPYIPGCCGQPKGLFSYTTTSIAVLEVNHEFNKKGEEVYESKSYISVSACRVSVSVSIKALIVCTPGARARNAILTDWHVAGRSGLHHPLDH